MADPTDSESGSSLFMRDIWDRVTDLVESAVDVFDGRPEYFDNCEGDLAEFRTDWYKHKRSGQQIAFKGQPAPVQIEHRDRVCMHNTACRYGTRSYQRKPWMKRLQRGEIPAELAEKYGLSSSDNETVAARMALHARFWKVSYHWVGLLNGDILYNNQPTRYTWHGNGANRRSIGVSAEGKFPALERQRKSSHNELTERFIETNRNTLRMAVSHSRDAGAPIELVTAHRCYSGSRRGDPGEGMWREIVLPVAAELDLRVDYSHKDSSGRPIPADWDDDAIYGFDGKPR